VECAVVTFSDEELGRNMTTGRTAWPFPSHEVTSSSWSRTDSFSRTSGFDVHSWIVVRCSSLTFTRYLQKHDKLITLLFSDEHNDCNVHTNIW